MHPKQPDTVAKQTVTVLSRVKQASVGEQEKNLGLPPHTGHSINWCRSELSGPADFLTLLSDPIRMQPVE